MTDDPEVLCCLTCPLPECVEPEVGDDWSTEMAAKDGCPWATRFHKEEHSRLYLVAYRQRPGAKEQKRAYDRGYRERNRDNIRAYWRRWYWSDPARRDRLNARKREFRERQREQADR